MLFHAQLDRTISWTVAYLEEAQRYKLSRPGLFYLCPISCHIRFLVNIPYEYVDCNQPWGSIWFTNDPHQI